MRTVLLSTDLYHRHADPNDHWNLATMFALARKGWVKLDGILCDDDRALRDDGSYFHFGDPAVQAVAQMNYLCGMAVPVAVGSRRRVRGEDDLHAALAGPRSAYATLVLETLQRATGPVDIHVCGSCKDVLVALRTAPDLFERRARLFLNAGTWAAQEPLEYNVSLEPWAYSQLFRAPCEVLWAPCFDVLRPGGPYDCSARANYYLVRQREIVPALSRAMKNYLNYMMGPVLDQGWLSYLRGPVDEPLLASWIDADREMWSTPGYLVSAGKDVTAEGEIVDAGAPDALFRYRPVRVDCAPDGRIAWEDCAESRVRMFVNAGPDAYQAAMPRALRMLLASLPDVPPGMDEETKTK